MKRTRLAVLAAAFGLVAAGSVYAAEGGAEIPAQHWSWQGIFGGFDQAQLQRGYLVYEQVCSTCHSMELLAFRHLEGLGFTEEQIDTIAANRMVQGMDTETGETITRPGTAADYFPSPYPNATAAAYTLGAAPPDLSVIVKAREGRTDYIHALLTGYQDPPAEAVVPEGKYYNLYFTGNVISMPPPLIDGQVQYIDGTTASVDQMARDVSAFLTWASEPSLVERKELGVKVILFLIVLAGIAYAVKRKIWSDVEH